MAVMIRPEELQDYQFDVPTAYLWASDRTHRAFMEQIKGQEEPGCEDMVWELGTFLYGEPAASLGWYTLAAERIQSIGFQRNPASPAMFSKVSKRPQPQSTTWYDSPENAHRRVTLRAPDGTIGIMGRDMTFTMIIVVLQVDDGKVVGNSAADIQALKEIFAQYNTILVPM